ncbi:MAG: hypothetical protein Q6361_01910 [Candidatus Hermodarchaeota archaeon]|jgi:hypothetical protein|nr:hypothetical protein [Candidatus Hermodarchaeota archaeon]
MQVSWPIIIIFIVIILLAACIVCVAVQDSRPSGSRQYMRTRPSDPWLPVHPIGGPKRKWVPARYEVEVRVCTCGKWNQPQQTTCWQCGTSLLNFDKECFSFLTAKKCAVCGFEVFPGDQVALCPACKAQGHRAHMLEFFKAKGVCPVCGVAFSPQQVLDTHLSPRTSAPEPT